MKKTFFNHDSSARNDIRVIKLRAKLGYEGYGIFWAVLELLFSEENKLNLNDLDTLAFGLQCNISILDQVINNFDLFIIEDGYFYSKRLNDQLNLINSKSIKAKENATKRWNNAPAMQTQSKRNAIKVNNSIIKNSKVIEKNSIENRVASFRSSINSIEGINGKDKEDFFLYWSELNKSGTKQKHELEKTWDLNRRLKRWSNSSFNKKEQGIKYPDYYDIHFAKRIEQDQSARLGYQKHLESIGYVKQVNTYDGKSKWIKK